VGRLALPVLLAATFMTTLDIFVVNVAIPDMQRGLHASVAAIQWVVAGFGLVLATGLVTAGRLGDTYGRRRMFGWGLAVFTLASAGCGLAPGTGALVAGRLAQGLGAALLSPQVLAVLRTAWSGRAQGRAFTAYGLTMGIGAVFGQLIGGLLIRADLFGCGWRACFLVNLPVGLAALVLVPRALPESYGPERHRLDLTGALLSAAAVTGLVLPLIQGRQQGWPLWTWLCLAASGLLFAAFGAHQHRASRGGGTEPVLHTALFRLRGFPLGTVAQLVFWSGQASFFLVLALYLQQGRGLTPLHSGVVFTVIGAGYVLTSMAADRIAERLGRATVPTGALVMAAGIAALAAAVHHDGGTGSVWWLAPGLAVDGVGMGMIITPLTAAALSGVPTRLVGSAAGLVGTLQQVGGALGVALLGIVFYGAVGHGGGFPHALDLCLAWLGGAELLLAALMTLRPRQT
jgi:EmrB/QacA subfamily drug resistance transporter